jgi:cobalamin biosynthesis protein CobT
MKDAIKKRLGDYRAWLYRSNIPKIIMAGLPAMIEGDASRYKVRVDDSLSPCTDGEQIILSLIPSALLEDLSEADWMICLRAVAGHECAHINWSSFTDVQEIRKWYGEFLHANFQLPEAVGARIAGEALNIVEDGRIERISASVRPGLSMPYRFLNRLIREGTRISERGADPKAEYEDFWKNLLSYAKTGLYAPGVRAYQRTRMEDTFLAIRALVDEGIAANKSEDCREVVQELLEEVSPYVAALIQASPELQQELEGQADATFEYTSDGQAAPNGLPSPAPGQGIRSPSPVSKPTAGNSQRGEGANEGADEQGQGEAEGEQAGQKGDSGFGFGSADDHADPLDQQKLDELRDYMGRQLDAQTQQAAEESRGRQQDDAAIDEDIRSVRACYAGSTPSIEVSTLPHNPNPADAGEMPSSTRLMANELRRTLSRILADRRKSVRGLRRGQLDPGALWKYGLKEQTIFHQEGNPSAGATAFYLLLDNSGSMDAQVYGGNVTKAAAARAAAAVVEEATKGLLPCKVALFNTSSGVRHTVLREFDDRRPGNRSWESLTTVGPGGCNRDSANIRLAALELARRREKKKVLLILSDGEPSAFASKGEAEVEVRDAVREARRKGIVVIPIMFGDADFQETSRKAYERMYEKDILACEPQEIATRLAALFQNILR